MEVLRAFICSVAEESSIRVVAEVHKFIATRTMPPPAGASPAGALVSGRLSRFGRDGSSATPIPSAGHAAGNATEAVREEATPDVLWSVSADAPRRGRMPRLGL